MDRDEFERRLLRATNVAIYYARQRVVNQLPEDVRYLVYPNKSYDGNPLIGDEQVYPQDTLPGDVAPAPVTAAEFAAAMWREGKVPEWIDLHAVSTDDCFTYLRALCCGRFTGRDDLLYHEWEGYSPFHAQGPGMPPRWKGVEASGKFDLHWRHSRG